MAMSSNPQGEGQPIANAGEQFIGSQENGQFYRWRDTFMRLGISLAGAGLITGAIVVANHFMNK